MTCSRRHTVISLSEAAHLPRGTATSRCTECGALIRVGAVTRQQRLSWAEPIAWIAFGLAIGGVVVRELVEAL